MRTKLTTLFLLLQSCFLLSYGEPTSVWLSDLLETPLKEAFDALEPSSDSYELSYKGSSLVLEALRNKKADIGIVASLSPLEESVDDLLVYPLCFQVSSIYVSDTNLVQSLSLSQIRGIYSASSDILISNWGDLGLSGYWKLRSVKAHAIKTMGDNSLEMLRHFSFPGEDYSSNITFWEDSETAIQQLTEEESSILIASAGLERKGMRAVFLKKEGEELAHPPSIDSVFYGDYELCLPFYLVLPKEASAEAISYGLKILSHEFSLELEKHFLGLPKNERDRIAMKLQIGSVQN